MNVRTIDFDLTAARRKAGLSQQEVARRMGTTQSAVSRVESGASMPSLDFLDRYARALGETLQIELGSDPRLPDRAERSRLSKKVLKGYVFDPWDRDPSPAEQRSLDADGLTRAYFERKKTSRPRSE